MPEDASSPCVAELQAQLAQLQDELRRIRAGEHGARVSRGEGCGHAFPKPGVDVESSRFRSEIVSQVSDAVVAVDIDGRVTFFNAAAERQYGVDESAALGRLREEIYQLRWNDPQDELAAHRALRTVGEWRGELRHAVIATGHAHPVESSVTVLRCAAGEKVGLLAVVRNITDRKRVEEALLQADRRKDEFLAALAHELRSPLAPIRTGLELIRRAGDRPDVVGKVHAMMDRQLSHLVRLVDDLMDVSRITLGRIELRRAAVDLRTVVESAVETSRPLIDEMEHQLELELPQEAVVVHADLTRLAQVFSNLLNNAARYTPRGGRIVLSAGTSVAGTSTARMGPAEGPAVVVRVRDNGIGIPPAMLPRIFEIFTQVDRSGDRSQSGLGIGLSLVKRLVDMHGGRIVASSGGPGAGSEFTVLLPLAQAGAGADLGRSHSDAALATGRALRILVVDDNRDGADSMAMMLRVQGDEVLTAYDGREALAVAEQLRPDLVLLDLGLPVLDGIDTCRQLRARAGGDEMMIVAQTGWGQDEDRRRTREAGFDHHIVKPGDPAVLFELLDGLRRGGRRPPCGTGP